MKFLNLIAATALATVLTMPSVQADTVKISVSKQAPEMHNISRPHNGMNKADVERIFGAPYAVNGPVGDPPISSWSYDHFTVYFEGDTVLHSVLAKAAPEPAQ